MNTSEIVAMTSQLSSHLIIMTCATISTPASRSGFLSQRHLITRTNLTQKKTSLLGASYHRNWPSSPIPLHSHRLPAPRSNPFDSFLDNVRKVAGSSFQPDYESTSEDAEDAENENTFVQLDPNSTGSVDGSAETTFGPLAMLAVGFLAEEFNALQTLLDDIGADEVKLVPCTVKLIKENTLGEALSLDPPPAHENLASYFSSSTSTSSSNSITQKVIFLSGMYASEVIEVVGAVRECDQVPDCAFAAAVPNSWGRKLTELVDDVFADHAAMAERRAQQMAQMEADRLSMEQPED